MEKNKAVGERREAYVTQLNICNTILCEGRVFYFRDFSLMSRIVLLEVQTNTAACQAVRAIRGIKQDLQL